MTGVTSSEDYLDAFMNGFEFVLLAMHGRLAELDDESQAKVRSFLLDYERVVGGYKARSKTVGPADLARSFGTPMRVEDAAVAECKN